MTSELHKYHFQPSVEYIIVIFGGSGANCWSHGVPEQWSDGVRDAVRSLNRHTNVTIERLRDYEEDDSFFVH
jgi:hypothetical protein